MKWILGIQIIESSGLTLRFSVSMKAKRENSLNVSDLLRRVPSIHNKNWGDMPPSDLVFAEPNQDDLIGQGSMVGSDNLHNINNWMEINKLKDILPYFPILQD